MNLFTKNDCSNCEIVKQMFDKIGFKYKVIECKSLYNVVQYIQNNNYSFDEEDVLKCSAFPIVLDINNAWLGDYKAIVNNYFEPLLSSNVNKYSMYPITYPDVYNMYKKARASYWQPEEITLSKDLSDWETMTEDEKHFISYVLAFFSASDGIVNENININFSNDIEFPEVRAFYAFQEAIESVHSETYSILLDKYIIDNKKKQFLQEGIRTIPSIQNKASWAFKYMNNNVSFAKRLLAFACVEGIYFSGSFCAIFWLKKRNLLPGLAFSNELISRDEALHTDFAVLLYNKLKNRIPEEDVHDMFKEAIENEKHFIIQALPCKLIGMNSDLMSQYIDFVGDRLLNQLGYNKIFNVENPFDFMENISLNGKTNFFEKRVGEYAKANVMTNDEEDNIFSLDADF